MAVMDAEAYRAQLAALLPSGAAWPRDQGTVLHRLLAAWADELARVDARAAALLNEAIPGTTEELLTDWERAYGLPGACLPAGGTGAARRAALVARLVAQGGQSPAYYCAVAAALGFSITITEYRPHDVESDVDTALMDDAWAHAWHIHLGSPPWVDEWSVADGVDEALAYWIGAVDITEWSVTDGVDEALARWPGTPGLACLISRLKPAHTHVFFSYSYE